MKKLLALCLLFLSFGANAAAESLPSNVQTITPQEIAARIEDSAKPFILFVYTSWCPYCKKQIMLINRALTQINPIALPPVFAISIDSDPHAYSAFLHQYPDITWTNKLYMGQASLQSILSAYGSSFDGPIPYLAVIKDKKVVKEFNGLTDPENLKY